MASADTIMEMSSTCSTVLSNISKMQVRRKGGARRTSKAHVSLSHHPTCCSPDVRRSLSALQDAFGSLSNVVSASAATVTEPENISKRKELYGALRPCNPLVSLFTLFSPQAPELPVVPLSAAAPSLCAC